MSDRRVLILLRDMHTEFLKAVDANNPSGPADEKLRRWADTVSPMLTGVKWRVGPAKMEAFAAMDAVYIEERLQRDGTQLWAVTRRGFVLNKDGEWEYEPQPSSREDDFLARTRWPDIHSALTFALQAPRV